MNLPSAETRAGLFREAGKSAQCALSLRAMHLPKRQDHVALYLHPKSDSCKNSDFGVLDIIPDEFEPRPQEYYDSLQTRFKPCTNR